jgi:sporulation protein YlmC with PRC-barrel domain
MQLQAPQTFPAASSSGRQWLASRLLQRQVVNTSTVEPVGHVADVAFDPESCQITGLMVQPTPPGSELVAAVRRAFGPSRTIGSVGLDHIIALNGDMVTIDSDPVVSALLPPRGRAACLCKVRTLTILTLHGICLGSLVDILLDDRGSVITGYVVNPTKQGESLLQPFEELGRRSPLRIERGTDAEAEGMSPESESSAAHWRVIPASPRVRIGKALILVVEEVEPLRPQPVVITRQ